MLLLLLQSKPFRGRSWPFSNVVSRRRRPCCGLWLPPVATARRSCRRRCSSSRRAAAAARARTGGARWRRRPPRPRAFDASFFSLCVIWRRAAAACVPVGPQARNMAGNAATPAPAPNGHRLECAAAPAQERMIRCAYCRHAGSSRQQERRAGRGQSALLRLLGRVRVRRGAAGLGLGLGLAQQQRGGCMQASRLQLRRLLQL